MINYKVSNLDNKTTKEQQAKLAKNLQAMKGIEKVSLHPDKGEISLSYQEKSAPEKSTIESAVTKAGFTLGAVRQ